MLLVSALAVYGTWIVMATALTGIGWIFLAVSHHQDYSLLEAFWLGLAISVAALEIWSLLRPVSFWPMILFLCAGALGLLAHRSVLWNGVTATVRARGWWLLLPVAMAMFLAIRACGPCDYSDTGLYGWPMVRWATTYPAVPGLANLHGRLGFNSSVFLCVAALNDGPWSGLAQHLFTGFLLCAMLLAILPPCARVIQGAVRSPADWFQGILAIPVVFWATRSRIVGTETDEPAAIACLAGAGLLFEALCPEKSGRQQRQSGLMVAATLFALAVTFKESTAVFALLAWCVAFVSMWRNSPTGESRRFLSSTFALSVAILLPWSVRSIILSGYPFYPATLLGFPVDWKVPLDQARWFAASVKSWGRNPEAYFIAETQGFGWLGHWLRNAIHDRVAFQVPTGISLGGLVAGLSLCKQSAEAKQSIQRQWLWLLPPSLAGIAFWFWAAPDLRFAQFAIWTAAATLGTWGITAILSRSRGPRAGVIVTGLLALMMWCLVSFGWKEPYRVLLTTKPLSRVPTPQVVAKSTRSGLLVYVPTVGDNCWDAPLPCTPYFDETLRLLDGVSLRRGFTSEEKHDFLEKVRSTRIR